MSLHSARPKGERMEVPPEILSKVRQLHRVRGGLTALALRAGLQGTYFNRLARGRSTHVAGDAYPRLIAALNGEQLPPLPSQKRWEKRRQAMQSRKRGGRPPRQPRRHLPDLAPAAEVSTMVAQARHNGNGNTELLRLLDGLTLGVEITRRTVFEHLGIIGKE